MFGFVFPQWAKWLAGVILVGVIYGAGYKQAQSTYEKQMADNTIAVLQSKEEQRERLQFALNETSRVWRKALQTNSTDAHRIVSDLRASGIRLRIELADARVCNVTGSCGSIVDGRAELSDRASEFLIGQAKRADDQVKGLQATVRELQGGAN